MTIVSAQTPATATPGVVQELPSLPVPALTTDAVTKRQTIGIAGASRYE
jgi:hypothetical protein